LPIELISGVEENKWRKKRGKERDWRQKKKKGKEKKEKKKKGKRKRKRKRSSPRSRRKKRRNRALSRLFHILLLILSEAFLLLAFSLLWPREETRTQSKRKPRLRLILLVIPRLNCSRE